MSSIYAELSPLNEQIYGDPLYDTNPNEPLYSFNGTEPLYSFPPSNNAPVNLTNMLSNMWLLADLINSNTPLKFNMNSVTRYKVGGYRVNLQLPNQRVGKTLGAEEMLKLSNASARFALQILLAMCIQHKEKSYYEVFHMFLETEPYCSHYHYIGPLPMILNHCEKLKDRFPPDTLQKVVMLFKPRQPVNFQEAEISFMQLRQNNQPLYKNIKQAVDKATEQRRTHEEIINLFANACRVVEHGQ
jgi:hypothetical protein